VSFSIHEYYGRTFMVERKSYEQLIGTIVGNYRVERLLERHPWGPIFLASTPENNSVLVRFLELPRSAERLDANARLVYLGLFQQEANHIASLQHPHILTLLDYGNYQGIPFLVYPSLSLVSLRALLSQGGPTNPLIAGQYLRQISGTLEYAHERAVIHRNLSTSCIFLYNKQQILISEFGMLRMREVAQLANNTQGSIHLERYEGSSEASSPEQLQNQSVDTYSDIYALGAVLYRMLTGQPPFSGPTREAIAEQHLYAEVPPIRRWRNDLPPELDQVIARAMAKEPRQRFRHPGELTLAYYQIVAPDQIPAANLASGSLESYERTQLATQRQEKQPTVIKPDARRTAKQPNNSRRRMMATIVSSATGIGIAALLLKYGPQFLHPTAANGSTATNSAPAQATKPPAQVKATQPATKAATKGAKVLARTTDVPLNSAKTFTIANQKNPGLLIHLSNDQFVAYDSTCTHEQCAVDYNKQSKMLECPCHGAVFDPAQKGAVVQPPARTPLTSIKIAVNSDGTITQV
jgi:serine/threonine protein kinase